MVKLGSLLSTLPPHQLPFCFSDLTNKALGLWVPSSLCLECSSSRQAWLSPSHPSAFLLKLPSLTTYFKLKLHSCLIFPLHIYQPIELYILLVCLFVYLLTVSHQENIDIMKAGIFLHIHAQVFSAHYLSGIVLIATFPVHTKL